MEDTMHIHQWETANKYWKWCVMCGAIAHAEATNIPDPGNVDPGTELVADA